MRISHVIAVMVASVSLLAAGCGHTVVWPPSAAEVNRINEEAARENGWLRVEYVEPIPRARRVEPIAIAGVGATHIAFRTKTEETRIVPVETIEGVTVKDRVLGAALWTSGLATAMSALVLFYWYPDGMFEGGPASCVGCGDPGFFGLMVGSAALGGAILGYAIGIRRTYTFTGRP